MEEQSHQNTLQLTSSALVVNSNFVSHSAEEGLNQHYIMEAKTNAIHHTPMLLSQWFQQPTLNYVGFLAENGIRDIQREVTYHGPGISSGFDHPTYASLEPNEQKVRYLSGPCGGAPMNCFTSGEHCNVHLPYLNKEASASVIPPKMKNKRARQRASAADRIRRLRIDEKLGALHRLLPQPKEGSKAALLDDITEHIKYLKLQIKEVETAVGQIVRVMDMHIRSTATTSRRQDLSRSRLGSESTPYPFIFLEGYGHYLLHDQMPTESLEDMLGRLVEVNPVAVAQLLESRGIFMMPISLAEGLYQTI